MAHIWIATHRLIHAARNTIAAFHVHNSKEYPTNKQNMDTLHAEPKQAPDACDPASTPGMRIFPSIQSGLVVNTAIDRELWSTSVVPCVPEGLG
jgi:hypothetical protein